MVRTRNIGGTGDDLMYEFNDLGMSSDDSDEHSDDEF